MHLTIPDFWIVMIVHVMYQFVFFRFCSRNPSDGEHVRSSWNLEHVEVIVPIGSRGSEENQLLFICLEVICQW